jgi:uncharacterized protein (TIGR02147 family)
MTTAAHTIDFFRYTDHRQLLRDLFEKHKQENPYFSHRAACRHLGYKSPAMLINILNGNCRISDKVMDRLSRLFKMNEEQARYFKLISLYNQAKSDIEKRYCLEEIYSFTDLITRKVSYRQYAYYQEWHHSAIRAIIGFHPFRDDYAGLARWLTPRITAAQARKAVGLLSELGFIRKNSQGYYEPAEQVITTGDEAVSQAISTYHLKTLDLAKEAIDRFPRSLREISTLTLGLSGETLEKAREEVRKCRKKILQMVRHDVKADRVYQFNFQLFPMTTNPERS